MGLVLDELRTVEFLADGPPELAARFMSLGRARGLPKGHAFWRAGQSPRGIVVPVSGEAAAIKTDAEGRELCYAFFGPGECAGVPCAVDGLPHSEDVRVIRPGEFFEMDRAAFVGLLDALPALHARVHATLGRLFRRSLEERDRIVFLHVGARVARFLLGRACVRRGDGARILLRETHAEIAVRLGTVREVVARSMAAFAEQGLIRHARRELFVADWSGLCAMTNCDRPDGVECSCGPVPPALLTTRHFLPVIERGGAEIARAAAACVEQRADLASCAARGCPLAGAARGVNGRVAAAQ